MKGIRRAAIHLALFMMMLPPILRFSGTIIKWPILLFGLLSCATLYRYARARSMEKPVLVIFACQSAGLAYLILISALHGFQDGSMIVYMLYGIAILFSAICIVRLFQEEYGGLFREKIILGIFLCGVAHSIIMLAALIFPGFNAWLYSFVYLTGKGEMFVQFRIRSPGLTSGGGAALSVMQACTFVCGIVSFPLRTGNLSFLKIAGFILGLVLTVVSIILSGRTGFLILLLWIPFHVVWYYGGGIHRERTRWKNLAYLAVISAVMVGAFTLIDFSQYMQVIRWAFEFYFTWQERGEIETHSTNVIQGMYFFPETFSGLLFGTSNFGRGAVFNYIESDVGYVLFIFGAGAIGMALAFSFYFAVAWYSMREFRPQRTVSILLLFSCAVALFVNYKELFFIQMQGWSQVFFLLAASLILERDARIAAAPRLPETGAEGGDGD